MAQRKQTDGAWRITIVEASNSGGCLTLLPALYVADEEKTLRAARRFGEDGRLEPVIDGGQRHSLTSRGHGPSFTALIDSLEPRYLALVSMPPAEYGALPRCRRDIHRK